jgi:adenine-specific DNA-methyltransferase
MPPRTDALLQLFVQLLPADGAAVGNGRHRQALSERIGRALSEDEYTALRDSLVASAAILKGAGRGGSVRLAAPAAAQPAPAAALPAPAPAARPAAAAPAALFAPDKLAPTRAAAPARAAASGARAEPAVPKAEVLSYRHGDKRRNNPEVGMVGPESDPAQPKTRWAYDPHLDPALQFDVGRAGVERLIDDALASGDPEVMRAALEELRRQAAPYLSWTGKAERTSFDVDTVSLHVHERIDPASVLAAVRRAQQKSAPIHQMGLFSAPFESLPLRDAIDFYKHDKGWSNRLVSGDSLLVMNSLLQKEGMAGQVQMIYLDPPYGIRYGSNFQPFIGKRDVQDRKDQDLTQEPEMIKAFRDTWELGIHSYLTYLRDRLLLARDLLAETGSIFVQISDENVHHVKELLEEVFGAENFIVLICYRRLGMMIGEIMQSGAHYVLWFAKSKTQMKFRKLFDGQIAGVGTGDHYTQLQSKNTLSIRSMTKDEQSRSVDLASEWRPFQLVSLATGGFRPNTTIDYSLHGATFHPGSNKCWRTTREGLDRLSALGRISKAGATIRYKQFLDDFPLSEQTSIWDDTARDSDTIYIVQTPTSAIQRCLLMTTDPGDLVLDPTCGSGTTAVVAEKWGRRWITCDTSRVAVTLAKQRLMTASYDYFELKYPHEGLKGGFIYKTVPHVTLKSIANNPEIDGIYERMHPAIVEALTRLNEALRAAPPLPFTVTEGGRKGKDVDFGAPAKKTVALPSGELAPVGALLEWEVPFEFPEGWPGSAEIAFQAFHAARQRMQEQMDASIAARADQEVLYDQPLVEKKKLRITGPFSVEAVPFPSVVALEEAEGPESADRTIARSGETARQHQWRDELLRTGIRGRGGQLLKFTGLETLPDTRYLHVSGHLAATGERVVVSFGPEHGALEQRQVEMAMREAGHLFPRPTMIVYAAFAFDPEAAKDIDQTRGLVALKAQMNTDLLTEDLKKNRSSNQSFWLIGQPDVELRRRPDGRYEVEVNGFDYFDTVKGDLVSGGKSKIAMWLLDPDYDERSLFPRQVFFPMAGAKDGWGRLRRDLRAELDEGKLAELHGTVSLPFEAGEHRQVAVKVVDDRGIESLKIMELG